MPDVTTLLPVIHMTDPFTPVMLKFWIISGITVIMLMITIVSLLKANITFLIWGVLSFFLVLMSLEEYYGPTYRKLDTLQYYALNDRENLLKNDEFNVAITKAGLLFVNNQEVTDVDNSKIATIFHRVSKNSRMGDERVTNMDTVGKILNNTTPALEQAPPVSEPPVSNQTTVEVFEVDDK